MKSVEMVDVRFDMNSVFIFAIIHLTTYYESAFDSETLSIVAYKSKQRISAHNVQIQHCPASIISI